ncbi:MAG TPA: methionyl-tRNA formyltransferase [Synergistaceae bacterium]|nr:methionyl-tRNA formyltransferase [Synergistaceae bacterium]HPQ36941.1 methionyl-tRNA formyltransferase [Synergistaceae bacterium]
MCHQDFSLWFAGTGNFAALCLETLGSLSVHFSKVITLPPRPGGRKMLLRNTPVDEGARKLGFSLHHTENINRDEALLRELSENPPQAFVVVDFGQLIWEPYLSAPAWGCLNVHPSLLPRYRGAAPIQRALMDGVSSTGVTVFRLTEAMDAGPILHQEVFVVSEEATSGDLFTSLAERGGKNLLNVLQLLRREQCPFRLQNEEDAIYAPKIAKEELRIDWNSSAASVHNKVRALNPAPSAYTEFQGKRLKIWKTQQSLERGEPGRVIALSEGYPVVACASGAIRLLEVQYQGKARQDAASWARGVRIKEDVLFGK